MLSQDGCEIANGVIAAVLAWLCLLVIAVVVL